ncbi:MAG: site-specific integrase [Candidatus Nealsonbacteria bacterium]|nr:site-specific integrase [Candidatus Nealsonbacteria bacterium]
MASLECDPANGIYRLRWRFAGRRYRRSLFTTDRGVAEAAKARVEETLRLIKQGFLAVPARATHDDAGVFILSGGRVTGETKLVPGIALTKVCDEYFEAIPKGAKAQSSINTERTHTRHLMRLLKPNATIRSIGAAEVQHYVNCRLSEPGQRGKPVQPTTVSKELQTFKQLWAFAGSRQYAEGDCPVGHVFVPKSAAKPPLLTWNEIEAVIRQSQHSEEEERQLWDCLFLRGKEILGLLAHVAKNALQPFVYPMFAIAAFTGARRSEIIRSKRADFNFERGLVMIREKKRDQSKSESFRHVKVHRLLQPIMEDWFERHPGGPYTIAVPPDMVRSRAKSPHPESVSKDQAKDHFERVLKGSKWQVVRGFHVFRHSFASNLAMRGVSQSIIDQWMGHQTEEMRRRYRHLFPEETQQAIDSFMPDIDELFEG